VAGSAKPCSDRIVRGPFVPAGTHLDLRVAVGVRASHWLVERCSHRIEHGDDLLSLPGCRRGGRRRGTVSGGGGVAWRVLAMQLDRKRASPRCCSSRRQHRRRFATAAVSARRALPAGTRLSSPKKSEPCTPAETRSRRPGPAPCRPPVSSRAATGPKCSRKRRRLSRQRSRCSRWAHATPSSWRGRRAGPSRLRRLRTALFGGWRSEVQYARPSH
jgi:hypothetical protein